jgi:predicted nucleic acid-binding protein
LTPCAPIRPGRDPRRFQRLDRLFPRHAAPEADRLDALLGEEALIVGDIVLTEVLQGLSFDRDFRTALALLATLPSVDLVGREVAIEAARNFRRLRAKGVTVRKTIDTLIGRGRWASA